MTDQKYTDVFVSYQLMLEDSEGKLEKKTFETDHIVDPSSECKWGYAKTHIYRSVTPEILDYLSNHNLCFEFKGQLKKIKQPSLLNSETFVETIDSKSEYKFEQKSELVAFPRPIIPTQKIEDHNFKVIHSHQKNEPTDQSKPPQPKPKKKKSKGFLSFFGL